MGQLLYSSRRTELKISHPADKTDTYIEVLPLSVTKHSGAL